MDGCKDAHTFIQYICKLYIDNLKCIQPLHHALFPQMPPIFHDFTSWNTLNLSSQRIIMDRCIYFVGLATVTLMNIRISLSNLSATHKRHALNLLDDEASDNLQALQDKA